MSQHFYQRYVPPAVEKEAKAEQASPPQNTSPFFNRYVPPSQPAPPADQNDDDQRLPKRPRHGEDTLPHREKKKKKVKLNDSANDVDDASGFAKHRDLQAKYEKAQERSSKQREVDTADELDDGVDEASVEKHGLEPLPQPVDPEPPAVQFSAADALPEWIANPLQAHKDERTSIDDLTLSKKVRKNLHKRGFTEAFAIQKAVIPMLMPGNLHHNGDLCVSASTGSGKTLSYVLPMVEALKGRPARQLRGLVVVPTRELVNQVRETLDMCTAGTNIKVGVAVGNRNMVEERDQLLERQIQYDPEGYFAAQRRKTDPTVEDLMDWDIDSEDEYDPPHNHIAGLVSSVDVLVCTPGRLVDHVRSTRGFHLRDIEWLVIDEADKLLDQSFQEWVDTVIPELQWLPTLDLQGQALRNFLRFPQQRRVQKVVLSATMTRDVGKLLSLDLKDPRLVVLEDDVRRPQQSNEIIAYQLPSSLQEVAVKLGRNDEKPLAFLCLAEEIIRKAKRETNGKLAVSDRMDIDAGEDTSTDGSSADSDSSTSSEDSHSVVSTSSSGSDSKSADSSTTSDDDSTSESEVEDIEAEPLKSKPESRSKAGMARGILVFANTNESAQRLSRLLSLIKPEWQSQIATLSKSTASSSSRRLLSAFRAGRLSILIASDRASRGLDIPDLRTVVNYDMPTSAMNYVHRVGRTARAGREGMAFTLVSHHEGRWFWKEIGKSDMIKRADKVARREDLGKDVPSNLVAAYETSLKKLGEEARGS